MLWIITYLILLWCLALYRVNLLISALIIAVLPAINTYQYGFTVLNIFFWCSYALLIALFGLAPLRRAIISQPLFKAMKKALPQISQTEREALEAGTTWWDAELFSGNPDWQKIHHLKKPELSAEEQAFIDGPVETLCSMLDDWKITHTQCDLSESVWAFIKQHKFCGLIIPKQYGGLDFSHFAHSEIVMKISSRSSTAAVTVMVPNSLGPAKLLLEYGTEQQKEHYLPRLANGSEIPCFALTGPQAGSDAGAMPDTGILCRQPFDGQEDVLGIRLNWEKRYITLGPVATVLGLAFKLYDPDHLLGEIEDIGITVALIPTDTPGINIGKRHFPLNSAFQNGPNWGTDVFIPIDWVIGGQEQMGKGWKMLVQSLSTGRGISLPALSTGAAKFTCRNTGAYARIRKQFNLPIGEFEGIQEVLARMAGQTYIVDAARKLTLSALDNGEKPAVLTAIIKYEATERMRQIINDGMDIQGGSGICLGPHNYLGRLYQVIPVGITVEGANILTRTMMIYGQGAIRCHPYIQHEMQALHDADAKQGLIQFDQLLMQHAGFLLHNSASSICNGLSKAHFNKSPGNTETKRYYQQISHLSTNFAVLTDYALLTLGGALKRKERLSGRFADVLSNLYLCSAVLKNFHDQGQEQADLALMHWACQHTIYSAQQAMLAIFPALPVTALSSILRIAMFPLGAPYSAPDDALETQIARILLEHSECRDRLTHGIYINNKTDDATGRIEIAFKAALAAAPVEAKIRQAKKQLRINDKDPVELVKAALAENIITQAEARLLQKAEQTHLAAIQVDHFDAAQLNPLNPV